MKLVMRLHRYLSAALAPVMLFFAVSGAWQSFRLHESRKDGSYRAPAALELLSNFHKAEGMRGPAGTVFKVGEVTLASLFALTALLGIVMAIRLTRPRWLGWAVIAVGVVVPVLLAMIAPGARPPGH